MMLTGISDDEDAMRLVFKSGNFTVLAVDTYAYDRVNLNFTLRYDCLRSRDNTDSCR